MSSVKTRDRIIRLNFIFNPDSGEPSALSRKTAELIQGDRLLALPVGGSLVLEQIVLKFK